MLNIYFKDEHIPDIDVINDIEKEFCKIKLSGTADEKRVIQLIESGTYNDSDSFIDRFGFKLHNSEMSTGCKAALACLNRPDKLVNLIECGTNARDIIINICKEGNILIEDNSVTYNEYSDAINVRVDDYFITNVDRLNKYVNDERPFTPELIGGIKHV